MCKHEVTIPCVDWILCLQCKEKLPKTLTVEVAEELNMEDGLV